MTQWHNDTEDRRLLLHTLRLKSYWLLLILTPTTSWLELIRPSVSSQNLLDTMQHHVSRKRKKAKKTRKKNKKKQKTEKKKQKISLLSNDFWREESSLTNLSLKAIHKTICTRRFFIRCLITDVNNGFLIACFC